MAPPSPVRPPSPDAPPFPDSPALQPPTSPQEPFPLPNSPVTRTFEDDVLQRRFFVAAHTSPQDWHLLEEPNDFVVMQLMIYAVFDDAITPLVLRRGTVDFTEFDFERAEGDVHLIVQVKEGAGDNDDDNALPVFTETDEADRRAELERIIEEGDATGDDPFNDPLNFGIQGLQGGNPLATGWKFPQGEEREEEEEEEEEEQEEEGQKEEEQQEEEEEDEEEFIERNNLPEGIVFPNGFFDWWSKSERDRFVNIVNNHPELPEYLIWPDEFFSDNTKLSDLERERKISIYMNNVRLLNLGLLDEDKHDRRFLDMSTKAPKPLTEAQLMAKARAEEKKREKHLNRAQKKREQEERARQRKEATVQREAAKNAKKFLKEQETIERQQEQAAMRERLKTMRKEDRDAYHQEYKERKKQRSEQVSDEMISATPWGQANLLPPDDGILEIDENDIPQMLIDLLQSHINSLQGKGKTGYRHVYYQGGDNSKGYKMRGYSAYLSITGPNSHRIALTNNLMAAVIMIAAAKIDPRLLSKKSASIWLKWMIDSPGGTAAAIKEWLADETVQQNIGELPAARARGGRPSGSAQQARDRRAQDPTYSEKDEMARLKSRKMKKKPKASSSAAGSSSSASVPIKDEELPLPPPLPTEQPTRPMTDEEEKNMAIYLAELSGIGPSEALKILVQNNFDLAAILGDDLVYEELEKDLEDVDLADFE